MNLRVLILGLLVGLPAAAIKPGIRMSRHPIAAEACVSLVTTTEDLGVSPWTPYFDAGGFSLTPPVVGLASTLGPGTPDSVCVSYTGATVSCPNINFSRDVLFPALLGGWGYLGQPITGAPLTGPGTFSFWAYNTEGVTTTLGSALRPSDGGVSTCTVPSDSKWHQCAFTLGAGATEAVLGFKPGDWSSGTPRFRAFVTGMNVSATADAGAYCASPTTEPSYCDSMITSTTNVGTSPWISYSDGVGTAPTVSAHNVGPGSPGQTCINSLDQTINCPAVTTASRVQYAAFSGDAREYVRQLFAIDGGAIRLSMFVRDLTADGGVGGNIYIGAESQPTTSRACDPPLTANTWRYCDIALVGEGVWAGAGDIEIGYNTHTGTPATVETLDVAIAAVNVRTSDLSTDDTVAPYCPK